MTVRSTEDSSPTALPEAAARRVAPAARPPPVATLTAPTGGESFASIDLPPIDRGHALATTLSELLLAHQHLDGQLRALTDDTNKSVAWTARATLFRLSNPTIELSELPTIKPTKAAALLDVSRAWVHKLRDKGRFGESFGPAGRLSFHVLTSMFFQDRGNRTTPDLVVEHIRGKTIPAVSESDSTKLTTREVAAMLGVSDASVRTLVDRGDLPCQRDDHWRRVPLREVVKYVERVVADAASRAEAHNGNVKTLLHCLAHLARPFEVSCSIEFGPVSTNSTGTTPQGLPVTDPRLDAALNLSTAICAVEVQIRSLFDSPDTATAWCARQHAFRLAHPELELSDRATVSLSLAAELLGVERWVVCHDARPQDLQQDKLSFSAIATLFRERRRTGNP